jgi:hypothetical protein
MSPTLQLLIEAAEAAIAFAAAFAGIVQPPPLAQPPVNHCMTPPGNG